MFLRRRLNLWLPLVPVEGGRPGPLAGAGIPFRSPAQANAGVNHRFVEFPFDSGNEEKPFRFGRGLVLFFDCAAPPGRRQETDS